MQIVSYGDNLHETSKPVFWENMKIIQYDACCFFFFFFFFFVFFFTQHAMRWYTSATDNQALFYVNTKY